MSSATEIRQSLQVAISLEVDCAVSPLCSDIAGGLLLQLNRGYEHCSVLRIPEQLEDWRADHRTARKRADRSARLGYCFERIERHLHSDEIFAINTSADERQGRPMSEPYRRRPTPAPLPDYPCARHCVRTYGVLRRDHLCAYMWLYRAGELALVSSILGHADMLEDDVMFLLFQGVVANEAGSDGFFVYNRHDSGSDGLRFFKERLGFAARPVKWLP
jgi:hypothetical protein